MKLKLTVLFAVLGLAMISCVPDNPFFETFGNSALDLIECQQDYLRPQTASLSFTTTYIVENSDGEPVANTSIFRELQVFQCDGKVRNLSIGFVVTGANGQFTETDNYTSNYTNDKIELRTNLIALDPGGKRSFRQRAKNGGTTIKFIIQDLED